MVRASSTFPSVVLKHEEALEQELVEPAEGAPVRNAGAMTFPTLPRLVAPILLGIVVLLGVVVVDVDGPGFH